MDFRILGMQIANIALLILGIFYSIVLHEMAHGYAAYRFGDDTAKKAGRISLNPIPHIDVFGTIILPLVLYLFGSPLFGWAKPVPVNPMNIPENKRRKGMAIVSIAGVCVNLIVGIIMFGAFFLLVRIPAYYDAMVVSKKIVDVAIFPHPMVILAIAQINIVLLIFNMLPFPPLDGYNFLVSVLPRRGAMWLEKHRTTLMIIFFVLLGILFLLPQIKGFLSNASKIINK